MRQAAWKQLQGSVHAFQAVFGNRQLRRLEAAWASAMFGYSGLNVVVMVYGYEKGGAAAAGAMALLRVLPGALAAPFTSVLADRYPRERVLLVSNLLRTGLVAIAAADAIGGGPSWVVFVLTAAIGIAGSCFRPAQAALVRGLARTPEELTAANVVASTIQAMGLLVAPGVAGALIAASSTGAGFIFVGGLLLGSTALTLLIKPPGEEDGKARERASVGSQLFGGFRTLAADRGLRLVLGLIALQTFVAGALAVMNVVVSIRLLGLGTAGVGYLNSAIGVGGLVGSLVAATLVGRARLAAPFLGGIFLWSIPLAILGASPKTPVALIGYAAVGIANMVSDVAGFTLVQRTTPDPVLARVFGILEMSMYTAMAIGSITAPFVISAVGIRTSLVVFGLLLPACVFVFGRRVVQLDRIAARPGPALELLEAIPIFAALPPMTLEQLASHVQSLELTAGEVVFKQGDAGDRFYIIAEGQVDVLRDGQAVRRLGPGDYFGEIALLRDLPRTATVIAQTDVKLHTLQRDPFVGAVNGDPQSSAAADLVIAERLGIVGVG
jgi:MFS family permease